MTSPVLQKKPHIEESSMMLCDVLEFLDAGEGHRLHGKLKFKLLNIVQKSHLSHDVYSPISQSTYIQRDSDNDNVVHFLQDRHRVVTLDVRQTPPPPPTPEAQSLPPYGTDPLLNKIYQCSDGDPRSKLSSTLYHYLDNFKMLLNNYHSPVLPIVNSTGLGKTPLMLECVKTFHHPDTGISYFSFPRLE
ncbi:hypothetical protein P9112_011615 [Eukaryota sp. TZLM1-RC]